MASSEKARPATDAERAQHDRGDFTRWECPDCGDRADMLGTGALAVGCARCSVDNKLVWMRRVPMPRVEGDEDGSRSV